ncbi:putative endonuclease 4 [Paenibacillus sp. J31TS4]|uniref:deoxyribonuclease IV n=1 Tax=Paenibacillus sp. J31TS4 TaxID=2807195 RepID=UPI001B11D8B1|nr:deoxyribonuclease IV [Paenibacillus sp. J31TS4]GIP37306.1 putative endonuclease 4 [Paenibacillus sp. J31TS4]
MRLGSHVSTRKGYSGAARTALSIGAGAFQYFPKNPRSLSVKRFDRTDAELCRSISREHGLLSIAHTPYPTNLAIPAGDLREATVASLRNDLAIGEACGSVGIIVHFGKAKTKDPLQGYVHIIETLNDVLDGWEGECLLLLENQAGAGSPMGTTMEEMVRIRELSARPDRIGFCLDTCHAFASGIWKGNDWGAFAQKGTELGYMEHLHAVHLNDSVYPYGEHKDRHANFGTGYIGEVNLLNLLRSEAVSGLPVVLETAAGPDHTHREELGLIRSLLDA